MVRAAQAHIRARDAFQIVLSQRFSGETRTEPFGIYRALRILNPSPYMFFLDLDGVELIGSSPEVLVELEGRRATLSPIAGTRPRGETVAHDVLLEEELLHDEKERAERYGRCRSSAIWRRSGGRRGILRTVGRHGHVHHDSHDHHARGAVSRAGGRGDRGGLGSGHGVR